TPRHPDVRVIRRDRSRYFWRRLWPVCRLSTAWPSPALTFSQPSPLFQLFAAHALFSPRLSLEPSEWPLEGPWPARYRGHRRLFWSAPDAIARDSEQSSDTLAGGSSRETGVGAQDGA